VHAYENGSIAWWIVDDETANVVMAPGTAGYSVATGAFADFDACVAANLANDAPVELEHAGGRLGVLVRDSPVDDNMAGVDGRNPSYRLEAVDGCVSLDAGAEDAGSK
jgi:polyisoprenoid-binding protein YceI